MDSLDLWDQIPTNEESEFVAPELEPVELNEFVDGDVEQPITFTEQELRQLKSSKKKKKKKDSGSDKKTTTKTTTRTVAVGGSTVSASRTSTYTKAICYDDAGKEIECETNPIVGAIIGGIILLIIICCCICVATAFCKKKFKCVRIFKCCCGNSCCGQSLGSSDELTHIEHHEEHHEAPIAELQVIEGTPVEEHHSEKSHHSEEKSHHSEEKSHHSEKEKTESHHSASHHSESHHSASHHSD